MRHVQRVTSSDVLSQIATLAPVGREAWSCDLLICCAGFEERATAIAAVPVLASPPHVLVIKYPTNELANARSLATLNAFGGGTTRRELTYDRHRFRQSLGIVLAEVAAPVAHVTVDVSAMSSYLIFRVLHAVFELLPHADLTIFYAEAAEYFPSKSEWDTFHRTLEGVTNLIELAERYEQAKFQSRGVDAVYESELYPGINHAGLATQIVMVPNFSLERVKVMRNFAETNYNVLRDDDARWLLASSPNQVVHGWRTAALAELYGVRDSGLPVSTLDPRQIMRVLEDIREESYARRHMVVATLGSKMQHVGVFLFLQMHPEVGLVLSEPLDFISTRFSDGVGPRWVMPLGRVSDLTRTLESTGTLRFEWH